MCHYGQATENLFANCAAHWLADSVEAKKSSPGWPCCEDGSWGFATLSLHCAGAPISDTGSFSANEKSTNHVGSTISKLSRLALTGALNGRVKFSVRTLSLKSSQ